MPQRGTRPPGLPLIVCVKNDLGTREKRLPQHHKPEPKGPAVPGGVRHGAQPGRIRLASDT